VIKENVEFLLTEADLTPEKIEESYTLFNRWKDYGGYRCDPSQFICMRESPPKTEGGIVYTLYKCFCPGETEPFKSYNNLSVDLGQQKVKAMPNRNEFTHCEFENMPYGDEIPFEIKNDTRQLSKVELVKNDIIPDGLYPVPSSDEIVCGIYHNDTYHDNVTGYLQQTIDSGLYFNGIKCPGGLNCLMKEFLVSCTVENVKVLEDIWINKKGRKDRRVHWPLCSCVNSASKGLAIPTVDPVDEEIQKLGESLRQAEFGETCDISRNNTLHKLIN